MRVIVHWLVNGHHRARTFRCVDAALRFGKRLEERGFLPSIAATFRA